MLPSLLQHYNSRPFTSMCLRSSRSAAISNTINWAVNSMPNGSWALGAVYASLHTSVMVRNGDTRSVTEV